MHGNGARGTAPVGAYWRLGGNAVACPKLPELCRRHTDLSDAAIHRLTELAEHLGLMAELSQADVFIDVLDRSRQHAWVVAQARPTSVASLYATSVVGQKALLENEPGVLRCLLTGEPSLGTTGISQEGVPIRQRVMPVRHQDAVIGALIMEANISAEVQREHEVALLERTTVELSETLVGLLRHTSLAELLEDGLLLVSPDGAVVYANDSARRLLGRQPLGLTGRPLTEVLPEEASEEHGRIRLGSRTLSLRTVPLYGHTVGIGSAVFLRDITDIRRKELELTVKDTVIRETHHRVKNNLQMMASLLRLQMRRSSSPEVSDALSETITRLYAIASVHETLLTDSGETVSLKEVALRIVDHLEQAFDLDGRGITVQVLGDDLALPLDRATSVALCLNELVQNSIRHAFPPGRPGQVAIRLAEEAAAYRLVVEDDGQGLREEPRNGSLGLGIVRTLVQDDLGGRFRLENGQGVTAEIVFPKGEG